MSSDWMVDSKRLYSDIASRSCRRSASMALAMSGYCSLQATSVPSGSTARCTWPRLAAAAASWPKLLNLPCQSGPSSPDMRRRTKLQPIGGALACSCASSLAYSSGSASGMVDMNCATFISGPFSPPRIALRSSAWADWLPLMPNTRWPAKRAAMPPTAPEVRAMRRTSPKMLGRSSDMLSPPVRR